MMSWFLFTLGFSVLNALNGLGVYEYEIDPYLPFDKPTSQPPLKLLKLKWANCNNITQKAITLTSLDVTPNIFRLFGKIVISGSVNVSQDVGVVGEVLSGDMKLLMKVDTGYLDLCSIFGPTICHKDDLCDFVKTFSKQCPPLVKKQGNDCTCPIKKKMYGVKDYKIVVNNMQFKMEGSFHFILSLKDKVKELGCIDLKFCINKCNW